MDLHLTAGTWKIIRSPSEAHSPEGRGFSAELRRHVRRSLPAKVEASGFPAEASHTALYMPKKHFECEKIRKNNMGLVNTAEELDRNNPDLKRYNRQMLWSPIGPEGQKRLIASKVLLVGCGALGTVLANTLARAGVGHITIVDRDFIELNNLQRQILFDEDDIRDQLPKSLAAKRKLEKINSSINIEAIVADVNHANIEQLAAGKDLLLDGTDNFETRMLINDVSAKLSVPWIYGGCISATGLAMVIRPGVTPPEMPL